MPPENICNIRIPAMRKNGFKDPSRKRTFIPEADVANRLGWWAVKHPGVIETRMINEALRTHLRHYDLKRSAPGLVKARRAA